MYFNIKSRDSHVSRASRGAVNLPPRGVVNRPLRDAVNMPPRGAVNMPPRGAVNRPPRGAVNLPPRGAVNLPPRGAMSMPPRGAVNRLSPANGHRLPQGLRDSQGLHLVNVTDIITTRQRGNSSLRTGVSLSWS